MKPKYDGINMSKFAWDGIDRIFFGKKNYTEGKKILGKKRYKKYIDMKECLIFTAFEIHKTLGISRPTYKCTTENLNILLRKTTKMSNNIIKENKDIRNSILKSIKEKTEKTNWSKDEIIVTSTIEKKTSLNIDNLLLGIPLTESNTYKEKLDVVTYDILQETYKYLRNRLLDIVYE